MADTVPAMTFLHRQVLATALCLTYSIQTAYTSNLYAFYTQRSIQVAAQDPDSGKILYSSCNSLNTPIFPIENPNVLQTFSSPRNGTALTAAGWWDGTQILATVFFQNEDGDIANCFYECDMKTGRFNRTAESYPSLIARVDSVHERTGLSVELLADQVGYRQYRLFYHNADRQIMMMSWEQGEKLWVDAGRVSPDTSLGIALASAYHEGKAISVVSPRGSGDIEVARLLQDDVWQLESFPRPLKGNATNETAPNELKFDDTSTPDFLLPFWDPDTQAIGHAFTKNGLREVYYMGTDRTLYQVRETSAGGEWMLGPNGSQSTWPKADERSGGLAVVSRSKVPGEVWIYYWVDGAIIQAYKSASGIWEEAKPLPVKATNADVGSPPADDNQGENLGPGNWSTAIKAGVGLGVTAGVLTAGALIWFLINRHNALDRGFRPRGANTEGGSHSDLPELYIVQRATPIAIQSSRRSAGRQPAELDQPGVAIWQKQADASWFLILRMTDRQLDLELRDGHSSVAASIPSTLAIRASHQEPFSGAPSLTLPSDFPGMITCVIPFSDLKLVKQADPSLDQSGVYILNILDPYEPSHYQIAKKNVRDLARRLQHDEPKTFGLLQCKGFFSEKTEAQGVKHITFTVVFRVPRQLSTPRSLRDVLINDPPGSLSRRFDIARDLVKAVNYVHTFGFVHKNVHPGAFLAFQSSDDASLSVFLAGFDSFRKEDGRTRRLGDDSVEKGLYRHPSRQGLSPEAEYIMQHDIYSLGVCLLEIGLWRSFISYDSKGEKPTLSDVFNLPKELSQQEALRFVRTSAAGHLLLLAQEKLSSCMGDKYADVVQTCLTCLNHENNDFGDQSEFEDEDGIQVGVRYIEKVLIKLNTLYV